MKQSVIKLPVKSLCIKTAAKKELRNLTDLFFNSKDSSDIILKKIVLLQNFFRKSDFKKLRVSDVRLSGAKESYVSISTTGDKNNFVPDAENILL